MLFKELSVLYLRGNINGNGNADLVTANEDGDTVSVILGDGNGGFGP